MTTRPILVGYDGSVGAHAAFCWALDEAARTGREVRVAYAFEWLVAASPVSVPLSWPDDASRREAENIVGAAVAEAAESHPAVTVHGTVLDGPAAVLLREQSRHASLVVLGSRGHGGFAGLLLGSTSVAVTAHAHCPVVVVRGEAPTHGHVAVGVDGSPCALLALGFAFEQALGRGAPLHVVRAWAPPPVDWRAPELDLEEVTAAEAVALTEMLSGWREKYPDVQVTAEVIADGATHTLVRASRHAQLVVVGSRGRGGFRGLLLGSVSQQLLQHSHCPVAVIRESPTEA